MQTEPITTLHFEPRGLPRPDPELALCHWHRSAKLPAESLERLILTADTAEVRVYVVAGPSDIEVTCEYLSEGLHSDVATSGIDFDLQAIDSSRAVLTAGVSGRNSTGWLRLFVTVPASIGVELGDPGGMFPGRDAGPPDLVA